MDLIKFKIKYRSLTDCIGLVNFFRFKIGIVIHELAGDPKILDAGKQCGPNLFIKIGGDLV
jgi:hypothetical protein